MRVENPLLLIIKLWFVFCWVVCQSSDVCMEHNSSLRNKGCGWPQVFQMTCDCIVQTSEHKAFSHECIGTQLIQYGYFGFQLFFVVWLCAFVCVCMRVCVCVCMGIGHLCLFLYSLFRCYLECVTLNALNVFP